MCNFVKGQKVICVDHRGMDIAFTKDNIYEVLGVETGYGNGTNVIDDEGDNNFGFDWRFETIIESIDDVVVGMEVTLKDYIYEEFEELKSNKFIVSNVGSESVFLTQDGVGFGVSTIDEFKEYAPKEKKEKVMREFVIGQKVVCVDNDGMENHFTNGNIYEIVDFDGSDPIVIDDKDRSVMGFKSRFKTAIRSIEDIVAGMFVSWENSSTMYEVASVEKDAFWVYTTDKTNNFRYKEVTMLNEYLPEEEEEIVEDVEYKVIEPFTIFDIYMKDPCKGEFAKLLKEQNSIDDGCLGLHKYFDYQDILESKTLMENFEWLEEKGFIEEVEKDVILKAGVKLKTPDGNVWTVIDTQQGYYYLSDKTKIFNFNGPMKVSGTLKKLNDAHGEKHLSKFEVVEDE